MGNLCRMTAIPLYGNIIAAEIQEKLKAEVRRLERKICLSVILVGTQEASEIYVKAKIKACEKIGICGTIHRFSEECKESDLVAYIDGLNSDADVHGILVQLPLPINIDQFNILSKVSIWKDVDCLHPYNSGQLLHGQCFFMPCTAYAVLTMLNYYNISIKGKHVVVINDTILLGRPLSALLTNNGATVTVCNKLTERLSEITYLADIIVVAVGKRPDFVLSEKFCKNNAIIIDCGINKLTNVVGDVDFDSVKTKASMVSVVPCGIGPITISILLKNVLKSAKRIYEME